MTASTGSKNENEKDEHAGALKIAKDASELGSKLAEFGIKVATGPHQIRAAYAGLVDYAFSTLIDQVEAVRRALREIDCECRDGDPRNKVVRLLRRLGDSGEWEKMEREMRMCAQLRTLHSQMHGFFAEAGGQIAQVDRDTILKILDNMIHVSEERMADYITSCLSRFASLADLVDRRTISFDELRTRLVAPIDALTVVRRALMELELSARNSLQPKAYAAITGTPSWWRSFRQKLIGRIPTL